MKFYGISGIALNVFINNQQHYTLVNSFESKKGTISTGVPQGSVLGPALFLLYINDIVNVPHTTGIIYADDTNAIVFTGENLEFRTEPTFGYTNLTVG